MPDYDAQDAKDLVKFWRKSVSELHLAGYSVKTIAVSMWYVAAETLNNDKVTLDQVRKLMQGVLEKIDWNSESVAEIIERARKYRWGEDSSSRQE